jgi:hypothetical protein
MEGRVIALEHHINTDVHSETLYGSQLLTRRNASTAERSPHHGPRHH